MSKLIVEIPDDKHKDLKFMALELDTTLRVVVMLILAVDKTYDDWKPTDQTKGDD